MDLFWHDHFLPNRGRGLPPTKAACLTGHAAAWKVEFVEWNYKLIACFARYVEIVSDVRVKII